MKTSGFKICGRTIRRDKTNISQAEIEKKKNFYDKQESFPIETVIEMTEQVPVVTKNRTLL
jgi:hypothetical protein